MARRKPVETPEAVDEADLRWRLGVYLRWLRCPATDPPAPDRFAAILAEISATGAGRTSVAERLVEVEAVPDRYGLLEGWQRHADSLAAARTWAR